MLLDVLLSVVLFAFVALTGLESVRGLSADVTLLAGREAAQAQLRVAAARLRADALAAVAVWKPTSSCGDAVAFMERNAAGTSFGLYVLRAGALVHAVGPAPLDPCDPTLAVETLVAQASAFTVTVFPAAALPAHVDPVSGAVDGGMLLAAGTTSVAVDVHALDVDGSPIVGGNALAEVTIDAAPVLTVVDLVAGNRPSGYEEVLDYACGGRCAANVPFPELQGLAVSSCTLGYDFANAPQYYVPASFALVDVSGQPQLVVTSYRVTGAYIFTFAGADQLTVQRNWTPAIWPPGGPTLSDPYPVNYATSALANVAPSQIASDIGAAASYAAALTDCTAINADAYYAD